MPDSPDARQPVYYPYVPTSGPPQGAIVSATPLPSIRLGSSASEGPAAPLVTPVVGASDSGNGDGAGNLPRKRSHVWAVIVVIVGVLVLAMLAIVLLPIVMDKSDKPGYAKSPSEAVSEFLTALSQGDAETAMLYCSRSVEDTTFLTNEFYSSIAEDNPITDIQVPDVEVSTSPTVIVEAQYTLDQHHVSATFTARRSGWYWLLDQGVQEVALPVVARMPVTLSGVDVSQKTTVSLLPGVYDMGIASDMISISNGRFVIEDPYGYLPLDAFSLALTESAIADIRTAAQTKLAQCIAAKSIAPDGCGFSVTNDSDNDIDPESITWTLSDNDGSFADLVPALDYSSAATASATTSVSLTVTVTFVDGHKASARTTIRLVQADFSDPMGIQITFSE